MSNRRSAILSVPPDRAAGSAEREITAIVTRRSFVKVGMPVFIIPKGSAPIPLYVRLGSRDVIAPSDLSVRRRSGLSEKEFGELFRRGTVYSYDIAESVRLENPVPLSRFGIPCPRPFTYSQVPLEEVLS